MIKIGDFSKLAHVSVKTLRHYGQLGLLKPARIDRYNGYRYYTLQQLTHLNRILALKDLGFSLEQIVQLLSENLSTAEMRGMLRMKQLELAEQVEAEQARLARVAQRLRRLEEGGPPQSEVAIKAVPAQVVLAVRAVAANEEAILPARQSLQLLLQNALRRARLKPQGPMFGLISNLAHVDTDLEVEMGVSIKPRAEQRAGDWEGSPITLRLLPAAPSMASVIHEGAYATISQAHTTLYAWAQANAYHLTDCGLEIYLPESEEAAITHTSTAQTHFTEVQWPVERAKVPASISPSHLKKKEHIMEPKIVTKPAFTIVGMSYVGKNEHNEVPQLWGQFNTRMDELENAEPVAYGVCSAELEGAQEGEFEYIACVAVKDASSVPDGMIAREIEEHKYAVFAHHGKLDTLGETYQYIYNTWIPQSEYEMGPHFELEVYGERFIHNSDESVFDIYISIE